MKRKWYRIFQENPGLTFVIAGVLMAFPFVVYDFKNGVKTEELMVNLQSSIFEVFVLTFFVVLYDKLRNRKESIERHRDEITSYLPWKEPEATYRIVGLIKALNKLGVTNINLVGAHLEGAILWLTHLEGAILVGAHLEGADLFEAHLEGADLFEAHLEGAELRGVHLEGADLTEIYVDSPNWITELVRFDVTGANEIAEKYKVISKEEAGKTVYRIELKHENEPTPVSGGTAPEG